MLHLKNSFFIILLGSLVFVSCEYLLPQYIEFDTESFNREWAAWEAQGLVNYSVDEEFSRYGRAGNVRIAVQNNVIIEKKALDEWTSPKWDFDGVITISEIYVWVNSQYERALERIKKRESRGITIEFTYNKEFHYPEYVSISGAGYNPIGSLSDVDPDYIRLSEFIPASIPEE